MLPYCTSLAAWPLRCAVSKSQHPILQVYVWPEVNDTAHNVHVVWIADLGIASNVMGRVMFPVKQA